MFKRLESLINRYISPKQKASLRTQYIKFTNLLIYIHLKKCYFKIKYNIVKRFFRYTPNQLELKLRELGIKDNDTIFMHSSFNILNGLDGGPNDIISCIIKIIGKSGNLLMVSMPYRGSSYVYLKSEEKFDVMNTISSMGIVTEIFRRERGILRSLNPIHPILAFGPDAKWIVSDHDKTMYSCGKGSPFEKITKLNAKALFFDVSFTSLTFCHYIEDMFKNDLPFDLYTDTPFIATIVDENGKESQIKTYAFSRESAKHRNFGLLEKELRRKKLMKSGKIGNTRLMLVDLNEVVDCTKRMMESGKLFYND